MTIDQAREIVNEVATDPTAVTVYGAFTVFQAVCVCQRACMTEVTDEQLRDHFQGMVDRDRQRGHEGAAAR